MPETELIPIGNLLLEEIRAIRAEIREIKEGMIGLTERLEDYIAAYQKDVTVLREFHDDEFNLQITLKQLLLKEHTTKDGLYALKEQVARLDRTIREALDPQSDDPESERPAEREANGP